MSPAGEPQKLRSLRICEAANLIRPDTGTIENHLGADAVRFTGVLIFDRHRLNQTADPFKSDHRHVIEADGSVCGCCTNERYVEARVIELSIENSTPPKSPSVLTPGSTFSASSGLSIRVRPI